MVDRESVVSDVRCGYCERAVGSCGAVLSTEPAFGLVRGRDGSPRPPAGALKGRERNDAVHAVAADNAGAADNAVLGSESVPCPKCNRKTGCLYRLPT
jgi:hypothetical protein